MKYQSELQRVNEYIRESEILYNERVRKEKQTKGLHIIEAYYGLDEHIYMIDSDLVRFEVPETKEKYFAMQVIPVRKQLQILVVNSSLVLPKQFEREIRGVFNPCMNPKAKRLLYVRFTYRELEKVLLYDFN